MNANGKNPTTTTTTTTNAAPRPALNPGDQLCQCIDAGKRAQCEKEFVFSVGEQKFFTEKGFTPPKRCKPCRDAKKAEKEASGGGGGGYNTTGGYSSGSGPGGYSGGYSDGGGGGGGGGRKKSRRNRDERDY
jgi:hypothetical protein